jgi:mono/diheme cytochrome c family protein
MTKMIRTLLVLAVGVSLAGAVAFAESGEAIYKANCVACHGSTGTPSQGIAKMMSVKPASDPSMKALSVADMTAAVKNGKGKNMKAYGGKLSDAQIKDVVTYFRTLK